MLCLVSSKHWIEMDNFPLAISFFMLLLGMFLISFFIFEPETIIYTIIGLLVVAAIHITFSKRF